MNVPLSVFRRTAVVKNALVTPFLWLPVKNGQQKLVKRIILGSRGFHTTKPYRNNNNDENDQKKHFIAFGNPFNYLAVRMKILLMRAFFDPNFSEKEFLQGVKQAAVVISDHVSSGTFDGLEDTFTEEGVLAARELHREYKNEPKKLQVAQEDILNMTVADLDFNYEANGHKYARVKATCFCETDEKFTKSVGSYDFEVSPLRIFTYSFRRDCTPGINADWLLEHIELKIQSMPTFQ